MNVVALRTLRAFWEHHAEAEQPLRAWRRRLEQSQAANFAALKQEFPSADAVPPDFTVFDVAGNHYRVVTTIDYRSQFVKIRLVMTHQDYDQWNQKGHPDVKDGAFKHKKEPEDKDAKPTQQTPKRKRHPKRTKA
jgi:mRNA interferase HigB